MNDPITNDLEEPSLIDLKTDIIKALTHTDSNFRALVELLPVSIMIERGGKIIYVNPSWLRLAGCERPEELIGESPLQLVHPDFHELIKRRIARVLNGDPGATSVELVIVGKDGRAVPIEAEEVGVIYRGIPAIMVVAKDISIRRKAQDALQQSEENLKAILELMPDAVAVEYPNQILFVNQNLIQMLGYEKSDELIGKPPLVKVHPDYRSILSERIGQVYEREGKNFLREYKWLKKDGSTIDVEVSSVSITFRGQKAVIAIGRDISERKKSQEELRESHFLLESAQRAGHVGTWVAELKKGGKAIWSEECCEIFGIDPAKFDGRTESFFSRVHPDDIEALEKNNTKAIHEGKGFDLDFRVVRPDGDVRWVRSRCEVIRDADGIPIKLIGTTQDITERKEAEELRSKTERQALLNDKLATVGTLAAGVAHEINNPLTFVIANLVAVKEQLGELRNHLIRKDQMDSTAFHLLNELEDETKETDGGIGRIRDIARSLRTFMHSGGDGAAEVNVNQLMDSSINMVFHEIKYKAKLEKAYDVKSPLVKVNPGKLQQVLINLLMNAAQAIESNQLERNRIRIRTGKKDENVFVEIQDTGQGIPEKNLKKIFDPFFTTKPVGVGTGLGLSICHQIIHEFGGQILVQSPVGQGSTFTILLPSVKENGPVQGPEIVATPPKVHKKILVVDDEPANVDTFGRMLKKQHEVFFALSGLDALGILEREKPGFDAIISDINMADMDGIDLYKNICLKYPGLEKRIVFVTGGIFTTRARDFLKSMPNPLLEKPFASKELLTAISKLG